MTLDESNEKDETFDTNGITFLIDPTVKDMIAKHGEVSIDYVDNAFRRGFMVSLKGSRDCC